MIWKEGLVFYRRGFSSTMQVSSTLILKFGGRRRRWWWWQTLIINHCFMINAFCSLWSFAFKLKEIGGMLCTRNRSNSTVRTSSQYKSCAIPGGYLFVYTSYQNVPACTFYKSQITFLAKKEILLVWYIFFYLQLINKKIYHTCRIIFFSLKKCVPGDDPGA
jgi:hypothetical protein